VSAKFKVGQAVGVCDRDHTYAGEIVKAGRFQVDIRYLGRVVKFHQITQRAVGSPAIYFKIPDDADGQNRIQAARQVLASHGIELSPRHTFTADQVEALADVVNTW
jgi:hypothetical protein